VSRRGVGFGFCAVAAFLFAARFVCAAIFGSAVTSWDAEGFQAMYRYVGSGLTTAALISLVVGIVYLVAGELLDLQRRGRRDDASQG
jgi:hypothetical protein